MRRARTPVAPGNPGRTVAGGIHPFPRTVTTGPRWPCTVGSRALGVAPLGTLGLATLGVALPSLRRQPPQRTVALLRLILAPTDGIAVQLHQRDQPVVGQVRVRDGP